jgi:5'-deoxynucleotidase
MRNSDSENVMELSWMVAIIAHGLCVTHNENHPDTLADEGRVALMAIYHDVTEVLTGDLPTPIKYHSKTMKSAFGEIERLAAQRLISNVPSGQQPYFSKWIGEHDEEELEAQMVKAADRISAWLKCVEERRMGNSEFSHAEGTLKKEIEQVPLDCVKIWMDFYADTFECSLDELELLEKQNKITES